MGVNFDFNGLDTAVHGPIRLGVMAALQVEGKLDFTSLKKRLNATDGALGMHLQKLQEAGYITVAKSFVNRRPKSTYAITVAGRKALIQYLQAMQRLADELGIGR
ncbi:MAG: winged helix-turn-helix domain-containing protein [Acidobacteriota bacterium]